MNVVGVKRVLTPQYRSLSRPVGGDEDQNRQGHVGMNNKIDMSPQEDMNNTIDKHCFASAAIEAYFQVSIAAT
jgi:hypothetical protein